MSADISILQHIQSLRGGLKPALQQVADAILTNPEAVRSKNIKELAGICGASEASISRFVRSIGLPSYRSFQLRVVEEGAVGASLRAQAPDEGQIYENIGRQDNASSILTKVAHRTADVSRACLSTIDTQAMEKAAQMICAADVVYFFAAGLSGLAAENALLRFSRIGKPAIYQRDRNNQLFIAGSLRKGALAIGISDSGRTHQTVAALAAARHNGASVIALTSFADSPMARLADVTIVTPRGYMPSGEEPIYESMVSKFAQLLAIDVLYSLVAVQDFDASVALVSKGDPIIQQSRSARRHNDAD